LAKTVRKPAVGVNVALIPPVPVLKLALVGVVDARVGEMANRLKLTGAKVKKLGELAIKLCKKNCFFCGTASHESLTKMKKLTLKDAVPKTVVFCGCLTEIRSGYVEYHPWKGREQTIMVGVKSGEINRHMLLYSDKCATPGCTRLFTVTAGRLANNSHPVEKDGPVVHKPFKFCRRCMEVEALRVKKAAKPSVPSKPSYKPKQVPHKTPQAQPIPQQTKPPTQPNHPVAAIPTKHRGIPRHARPLRATLRDQLVSKGVITPKPETENGAAPVENDQPSVTTES
jgi:hypothetical protein